MKTVLVTGFGRFPGVDDNPTERLAQAVDGYIGDGFRVVGRVLPVSWARGPQATIDAAREVGAALVVGLGVAVSRRTIDVECQGVRAWAPSPDVDGATEVQLDGPERVLATIDCARLARALDAGLSNDAGRYVCNAWIYRVVQALTVPVGFIHVPPEGLEVERLLLGIDALVG